MPQESRHNPGGDRPAAERQFVDREEFIALFRNALKASKRTKQLVLVFHGGAGIGKSRLRRELVRIVDSSQQAVDRAVVTATLDFAIPSYRQNESALLFVRNTLHEAYNTSFPSFDLAYAVLWQKAHPDTAFAVSGSPNSEVRMTNEALDLGLESDSLIAQLLDESGKLPVIGLIPRIAKLVSARLDPSTTRPLDHSLRSWWERRGEREMEDLPQMEPAAIVEQLPKLWAADLRDYLGATSRKPQAASHEGLKSKGKSQEPKAKSGAAESYHQDTKAQSGDDSKSEGESQESATRDLTRPERWTMNDALSDRGRGGQRATRRAVLFIDSYETLWETGATEAEFLKRDAWVRELVKQLPEVSWVICGRQRLRWEEVEKEWGDVLSQHELGPLSEHSARQFLSSCGIANEPIQDAIVKGSQGLPHYLNLAVDTYLEIKQSGERVPSTSASPSTSQAGTPTELFAQFIRHLNQPQLKTLQILSASRFWYYGLFEHLVTEYQTGYPLSAYDDLSRFSFIRQSDSGGTQTMHELMREVLQEHQAPELRKRVHLFLHEYYAKQLDGLDVKNITEKHKAALTEAFYHGRQSKTAAELWAWFEATTDVFGKAGQDRLLSPLYREMVQALEAELGPGHPDVARSLNYLARAVHKQGRYAEAEPLFRRALALREKVFGPEHPEVAQTLRDLAGLLDFLDRHAEAEPLLRRSLAIRENVLGPEHPDTGSSLAGLVRLLRSQGRFAEAEPLSRRSLAIAKKAYGPEHPLVSDGLYDLATTLNQQSRHVEAETLYRRALAIREKTLGPVHPSTADAVEKLALLSEIQGRYADAEPLYQRALTIYEETLGPENFSVARTLDNLATLLVGEGRYAEAEPLARRALAVMEKVLGPEHLSVAHSLQALSMVLKQQGRYTEAEPLMRHALALWEKGLGPEHEDVSLGLDSLAMMLEEQRKYPEAEPLYRRSLTIKEKTLGPEHPDVAIVLNNLSMVLGDQQKYAEAESLVRRALVIWEKALGPEHPNLACGLETLSSVLRAQRKYAEAESSVRRALAIEEAALGLEHPDVPNYLDSLSALLVEQQRHAEAEPLARRALAIRELKLGPSHPDVAKTLDILTEVCEKTGRAAEAQELSDRAKAIRDKNAEAAQAQAPSPS